jgi:hypothetical protein
MNRALCSVGDMMTGFILVSALRQKDEVDELLDKQPEWMDAIINTTDISVVYEETESGNCVVMLMSAEKEITTKESLDEIIQKIRRSTAINFYTQ